MPFDGISKFLRNTFSWEKEFDWEWEYALIGEKFNSIPWGSYQRVREKKSYWREHGRKRKHTPQRAVYEALIDVGEYLHREHGKDGRHAEMFRNFGWAIGNMASKMEEFNFNVGEDRIPVKWRRYFEMRSDELRARR